MKNQISVVNRELKEKKSVYKSLLGRIHRKVSILEKTTLMHQLASYFQSEAERVTKRHYAKLKKLWITERCRSPKCLINLSKRKLSVTEENILRLGLKHHILPKEIKGDDLKVDLEGLVDSVMRDKEIKQKGETGTWQHIPVSSELKDQLKFSLNSFSSQCKNICSSKKNQAQHKTLRKLAIDKNIKVCKFDKGNGVVILDSDEYFNKLDTIILDKTKFKEIEIGEGDNPIIKNELSIQKYLRTNVKPLVEEFVYKHLYPTGSQPGKLYGMCKVHKQGNPLRPVISMINSAEYNLAKWLDSYIKPNIPNKYSVASTSEFLEILKETTFDPSDKIVSFDVVSLFTNIPLGETIEIIVNALYAETSIRIPPVPKMVFKCLLQMATGGMFMYKDILFKQVDGVAMGSPLGPSLANFFLGHIENTSVFDNPDFCPKLYLRYVDDIFAVFPKNTSYHPFFEHLNKLHKNLAFTVEEASGSFPFLDIEIEISGENVDTWVFRKKTHTGVMLNFSAIVPNFWKVGLIRCLLNRAKLICSSIVLFDQEVDRLKKMFMANGYPKVYFEKAYEKFIRSNETEKSESQIDGMEDRKYILGIPYVGSASREYKKKLTELFKEHLDVDLSAYFTSCKIARFFSLKSKTPFILKARVLYKFPCLNDSDTAYIGKTKRHIVTRAKEHVTPKESNKSEVKNHIFECNTCKNSQLSVENFSIMKQCKSDYTCKIAEALFIKKFRPRLNKQKLTKGQAYLLRVF